MTDSFFFDSDCISAFLWINGQSLLTKLYSKRIVIPKQVYNELSSVPHLRQRVDTLIQAKEAEIMDMDISKNEYKLYLQMTTAPENGYKIIGDGEAASIALAKENNGVLASNNLRDISQYVRKYNLSHVTTGDILIEALNNGLITESEGNQIWANMLAKRRKLGALSFSEYLSKHTNKIKY
ncbi:MAG: hypothetical protein ACI4KB_05535 [Oscillospiraceae bacterium]|nr:hypothetical protein [Oscillospiraceae bacterium]